MLIFDQIKKDDPHLKAITWCVLAGMGILLAGLWYVQVISHRHYAENQKNQSFRTVRIPAIRGKIMDRQGRALADNEPTYNISLYIEELRSQFKAEYWRTRPKGRLSKTQLAALQTQARSRVVSNVVHTLQTNLRQPIPLDERKFHLHYTNQLALPYPIMSVSNAQQLARFHEQASNPPGVDLEVQPIRKYPYGSAASHLLGFLVFDNSSAQDEDAFFNFRLPDYRGLVGIEGVFDQELRGKAGVKSVLVNNLGYRQSETIWSPAESGRNVTLTIDIELQRSAERALRNSSPLVVRGAVVVMDPNNGDILALASNPSFDPNMFIPRLSHAEAKALADVFLKPQRNRATQENYAPGSIFKIVTALACLEAGLDPHEIMINQPSPTRPGRGCIMVGERTIHDTAAPGEYDFRRAFIKSCNSYFISNTLRYNALESLVALGQRLGLGERAGLPTRQDSPGNFPSARRIRSHWYDGHTANLAIGQGEIAVTPVQMAVMTSAIANGGKVFWPRLVARVDPQDAAVGPPPVEYPPGRVRGELGVSARSLALVREAMLADVEDTREGTGNRAAVPGLRIGGKTGTAEVTQGTKVVDQITWFASYAPIDQPKYAVIVMVETGESGATTCAPITRQIYEAIQKLDLAGRRPNQLTKL
jgi:penicillin-binding protein 2